MGKPEHKEEEILWVLREELQGRTRGAIVHGPRSVAIYLPLSSSLNTGARII